MATFKKIAGWDVNIDHYSKAKTLKDLKKNNELFDNMPAEEKEAAFEALWNEIKPPPAEKESQSLEG